MVETVHNIKLENRKALKSLQNVAGVYGLVVPCEEVQFPGVVVGYLTGRRRTFTCHFAEIVAGKT